MRKFKHLEIPDRKQRTNEDISKKQNNYCEKSACYGECCGCLFAKVNLAEFEEWYLAKNKI